MQDWEEHGSAMWIRDHALQTHSFNWKHDVPDDNVMGGTFKKEHLKSIKIIPCPVQLQEYDDCPPQRAPSEPCTAMDCPAPAVGTR